MFSILYSRYNRRRQRRTEHFQPDTDAQKSTMNLDRLFKRRGVKEMLRRSFAHGKTMPVAFRIKVWALNRIVPQAIALKDCAPCGMDKSRGFYSYRRHGKSAALFIAQFEHRDIKTNPKTGYPISLYETKRWIQNACFFQHPLFAISTGRLCPSGLSVGETPFGRPLENLTNAVKTMILRFYPSIDVFRRSPAAAEGSAHSFCRRQKPSRRRR